MTTHDEIERVIQLNLASDGYRGLAIDLIRRLRDERDEARETLISVTAHLAAAISLLEKGGKAAKKAAPSDRMFDQMLTDYRSSLSCARAALRSQEPEKP